MRFFGRRPEPVSTLGVFPGTFNPVTVAHMDVARAALTVVDELLFILPEELPHKPYSGATFTERIEMLESALCTEGRMSLASSKLGLFRDIAAECAEAFGRGVRLWFVCGTDAAERVANWDYGEAGAFECLMSRAGLLVASRVSEYLPHESVANAIRRLTIPEETQRISASDVRKRIAAGGNWERFVPPAVRAQAARIYGG